MLTDSSTHKQLRSVVAERMRQAILEGVYKPGEWLRQERLAQELGVSQMPVREALKELTTEGLIEHVPYRGARVIAFSPEDILDLYHHRAFLEGRAAAAAATNITQDEFIELERLRVEMERHLAPEDVNAYREFNRQFHKLIATASRREYLIRTLTQMWSVFPTMLIANFVAQPLPQRDNPDIAEHRAIVDAIRRHDAVEAENVVKEHIIATGQQLVTFMRSQS